MRLRIRQREKTKTCQSRFSFARVARVARRARRASRRGFTWHGTRAPKPSVVPRDGVGAPSPRSVSRPTRRRARRRRLERARRESFDAIAAGRGGGIGLESRGGVGLKKARNRGTAPRETHLYSMMWGSGLWMA